MVQCLDIIVLLCVCVTVKICDRNREQVKQRNAERADTNELFMSNLYLNLHKDMTELEQEAVQTGLRVLTYIFK